MKKTDIDMNPFEKVKVIAQMARDKEWADKENIEVEDNSLKKIINRPSEIKNYTYDAFCEFHALDTSLKVKEDDLS